MDDVVETSSTSNEASVDTVDQISDLLMGDSEKEEEETSDSNEDENLTEESTEVDESDEEESEDDSDEGAEEVEPVDDSSWGSVLGIDEDKLKFDEDGNMVGVNVKVDGESSTVNMNDLVTGYQSHRSFTQKSQKLAEEKQTFERQVSEVSEDYKSKLENVEALSDYLGKQLTSQYDNVDWNQLRTDDPAEYAALRQDYATRAREIQQAQDAIKEEKNGQTEQETEKRQGQHNVYMKGQYDKMIENNPSWTDKQVYQDDMTAIRSFAGNQYGFNDADFGSVSDSRIIEVLKDAKAYREGVKKAVIKRKKPVPKFQKSVGKSRKRASKLDTLTKRAKSATGANKRHSQTDAIAELLGAI